ncbi:MAG: hypothetical protein ACYTG3_21785, partial [Planctomycetota bacterium]
VTSSGSSLDIAPPLDTGTRAPARVLRGTPGGGRLAGLAWPIHDDGERDPGSPASSRVNVASRTGGALDGALRWDESGGLPDTAYRSVAKAL